MPICFSCSVVVFPFLDRSETRMNSEIFISYRRLDSDAVAGRIYDQLDSVFMGQVFMDVEAIKPGRDFHEEIIDRVRNCKVVLVLIGSRWRGKIDGRTRLGDLNDYVTLEVKAALETGCAVIPVLIGEVAMPTREELPAQLQAFAQRHAVRLRQDNFTRDMEPLVSSLYEYLGIVPKTPYEKFLESVPFSFGFKFNEKMRGYHAILSVGFGALLTLAACAQWISRWPPDVEFVFFPLAGVYCAFVGKNSNSKRKWALAGLTLSLLAMLLGLAYGIATAPS